MSNIIKIENITKKYEKNKTIKVLNDVSFNFESGKIYSVEKFNRLESITLIS